jgi:serine/threonine-protein kinase
MGTVYRARHALLKRPTAVKLVDADRAHDPAAIRRFHREVEATSLLTHPNTISVYDFGSTKEGFFYYAMEFLDGADLDTVVQLTGPMTPGRVVHVLVQACGSLQEAHEAGLIHRDIKPANIMLCTRGGIHDFVKVLDFGLVKTTGLDTQTSITIVGSTSDGKPGALTQAASLLGTPHYISPEAVSTPHKVGPAADIYALGAVMWFLLVGKPVFEAATFMDLCLKHTTEAPRRPSKLRPDVPGDLEAIVMACLEKKPTDRPASTAALATALAACACAGDWTSEIAGAWWKHHAEKFQRRESEVEAPAETNLSLADAPTLASEHP